MPSTNVADYPTFREYAARFGADEASWVQLGIQLRTDAACAAARARMTAGDRADRGRYARLLAAEVARATTSRSAWEACARETERRVVKAEAKWKAERHWTGLKAEIDRHGPTRQRSTSVRATVTPPAPPTAARRPAPPTPVAADPLNAHADHLDEQGFVFAAAAERKALAQAGHNARRRQVEEEVTSTERLFQTLVRNYGRDYAERFMQEGR